MFFKPLIFTMPEDRRLAAIMFTDIVGYTALMGSDEDKAFKILRKNRNIQKPLIKKYNGKWLKEMGDGILASFNNSSDAVRCAGEIQHIAKKEGIELRIGIHEGEVVFEDGDVLGDGVNVASRLQELAQMGCIYISGAVYKDIKNKAGINTVFIEEKKLKNVEDPIRIYEVKCEDISSDEIPGKTTFTRKNRIKPIFYILSGILVSILVILFIWKSIPIKKVIELEKSIAILPFNYLSQEKDKQYLADGLMDAITSNLAKISELKVVAKKSVMKYKEHSIDVRDIGKELDVSYLVEGSFQLVGDQARLIIQLINTKDGNNIWSNEYDREWSDIFKVQSEVSQKIADEIAVKITPETKKIIESVPTKNLTAYDFYLKGVEYENRSLEGDDFLYAYQMYKKAIEIDSSYTLAWVGLAASSRSLYWVYYDKSNERINQTKYYLDHAANLNDKLVEVQLEEACYLYQCERDYTGALKILNRLRDKYPKNANIYFWEAVIYKRMGEFEKSINYFDQAIQLDPSNWGFWSDLAISCTCSRDYYNAEKYFLKSKELNPSNKNTYRRLSGLYYLMGDVVKLKELLESQDNPTNSIELELQLDLLDGNYEAAIEKSLRMGSYVFKNQDYFFSNNYQLGLLHFLASEKEKAIEYFQKEKIFLENEIMTAENDDRIYRTLAIVYAGLGENKKAINASDKTMELLHNKHDAILETISGINKAYVLLMIGNYDEGISKLENLLEHPGLISVEYLKNHHEWRGFLKNEKFKDLVSNPKYQLKTTSQND